MKKLLCSIAFVSVRSICCTALVISFSFYVKAQDMAIRTYTIKDGLPSTFDWSAYQDKLGYLWVGSPDGLSRFNGKSFTNYGLADGLPDARALMGFMDSHLRFWAITPRGVAEFKGNRFISYPLADSQNIRWVFQVLETQDGRLWCLTNVGVYQFNWNKWTKIKLYPGYENHPCHHIIETNEGLYINYGDLLVLKKPDATYKIIGELKDPGYYYNGLTTSAGQIFISTLDGIYEINDQHLVKLPGALGKLKGIYVYFRDSKKRFWVGRFKLGVQLFADGDSSDFITIIKPSINFLPQDISEDNQGNIWIGSGNGLIKISEPGFKIFDLPEIIEKSLLRNVLQPPGGPLLINNGSLTMFRYENGVFSKKKLQIKSKTRLPNNELIIDNYAFDNKNRYWYNVRGVALVVQDGDNIYEQSKQLAHLGDQVFDVLYDSFRKKIIVAVYTQKFPCQFNNSSYSILPVANNIEVKGNIMRLHQCANGVILFATDRGLIYSIDKQNICKLQLNEFKNGSISKFYNDSSGDTWIIYYGRGLRRYFWRGESLVFKEQVTKTEGLSNDNVRSICFDSRNNLWICTNSNVAVFSKKRDASNNQAYQIISFFDADDLQMHEAIDAQITKDNKGNIWLFSGKYLICFYPDKINFNQPVSSIEIENIELNLRQTNWAAYTDSLSGIFQLPYHPKLSHDNNTLGIYFKGISSSGTDGIKYSYQLEGLKNLWSSPSSNDFVSFVNLPPGSYAFKVKAQLPNSSWSEPAVFSFAIKKAFWQTIWFYLLVAISLAAGVYLLFRYRLQQKINLFEMRNRISQDLHDEIGASMSGINLLGQMAVEKLEQNKPEEASVFLFKVKNYTQDVIEKLSDMVWVFNPQNDSIEKLLQRLKYFTVSVASSKNIKVHFVTDKASETMNLTIQQRKAIYLISKEAFNNAFKSSGCTNIYYNLTANGSKWQLRIQDDGKGFIPAENTDGNGLRNMQARADEIGAEFSIHSKPAAGTIIMLVL
jgi:signal transduction histidine kinase/ligand-binding sensor domain-containing protein